MAFNYTRSKATAERLLANFGQTVTLRKRTASGSGRNPSYSETDTSVVAVDLNEVNRNAPGSLNERTDRKLLVSTSAGVAPDTNDRVLLDGEWHTIGMVMPLAPGGTTIMYEAELVD